MSVGRKFSTVATPPRYIKTRKTTKKKNLHPGTGSKRNKEKRKEILQTDPDTQQTGQSSLSQSFQRDKEHPGSSYRGESLNVSDMDGFG